MAHDELPLNDERRSLRKGTKAWRVAEFQRYQQLARKHDGLTSVFFAKIALGVSRQRVYQLMEQGHLHSYEVLGKKFIACDMLERFMALERDTSFRYIVHEIPA